MADYVLENIMTPYISFVFFKYLGKVPTCFSPRANFFRPGHTIYISSSLSPNDVNWSNLGAQTIPLLYRKIISLVGGVLILLISFVTLTLLKIWQIRTVESAWISVLLALTIKISNTLFSVITNLFVVIEKSPTETIYQSTLSSRGSLVVSH